MPWINEPVRERNDALKALQAHKAGVLIVQSDDPDEILQVRVFGALQLHEVIGFLAMASELMLHVARGGE